MSYRLYTLERAPETWPTVIELGGYTFELPSWWREGEQAIYDYVYERYGSDTGTKATWREVMKLWVLSGYR
ncbi:hypothetical protein G6O69_06920 [Pseudenhygromyxa sp. WMMC2535]|uniref:hypothetical protein n=1 Tax=Pseudenhygromyxa sp. WMMC2535 TaxID=2712867 RepID=UPI001553661E|nr:hypothetical protein [Pseudenhygromyxa sp. WMMC2535]NVB37558.1 hypothetical protein [Pseudenhygromyxa sp. WMMC2535]